MSSLITPERILEMQEFLEQHPPDPAYDERAKMLDGDLPPDEFKARCAYMVLKKIGKLPE